MRVTVHFYSYFKELTGCDQTSEELTAESTIADLQKQLIVKFPKLESMKNSTLIAVDVEYQTKDYVLRDDDEVSLFPPVQGG